MKYMSNTKWLFLMMMAPVFGWAQQSQSAGSTYFSNALFNTLMVVIIMLLILVIVLSNSIRNIIQSDYFKERYKKMKEIQSGKGLMIFFLVLFASQLQAQTPVIADDKIGGVDQFTFYFLLSIILLEVIVVILLFNILRTYTKNELSVVMQPEAKVAPAKPERTILDVFNASVEIEKEEEIMLDHDYDGIKELDNNLPPW